MNLKYIYFLLFVCIVSACNKCEKKKSNPSACLVLLQEDQRCAEDLPPGSTYIDYCSGLQYAARELCMPTKECNSSLDQHSW
ncbi:hypothetical protein CH371_00590 [Leptospira wolffii]|uniref:Lipoprotein n=1 Tax=Leptospira wolffii TaxID=409998 RepID=A0A2M9ZE02_9LEPT|nr:hypothetical protein CH371_00590 [Leptospira wolffii]